MKLFVLDPDPIHRRELVARLARLEAELVIVDHTVPGGGDFISAIAEATGASVLVCASGSSPELLGAINGNGNGHARPARLTDRERQVMALIAAGHPTREVAEQLCYSERTVKSVLQQAATKLGARNRSQAVASAVREGLI